jgi:starch synthase
MLACLIRELPQSRQALNKTKIVLSIHNPAFQGMMDKSALLDFYGLPEHLYENGNVRFNDRVSSLKTAIVYADKITTVSPNHRLELLTAEGSMGLSGILQLREYDFVGILNGIDYEEFNPKEDKYIKHPYNGLNIKKQKLLNKKELFEDFDLIDLDRPLFSMVSRITWQKGMEILLPTIEHLLVRGCNVMVLGSGDYYYEQKLEELLRRFPNRLAIYIGYMINITNRTSGWKIRSACYNSFELHYSI